MAACACSPYQPLQPTRSSPGGARAPQGGGRGARARGCGPPPRGCAVGGRAAEAGAAALAVRSRRLLHAVSGRRGAVARSRAGAAAHSPRRLHGRATRLSPRRPPRGAAERAAAAAGSARRGAAQAARVGRGQGEAARGVRGIGPGAGAGGWVVWRVSSRGLWLGLCLCMCPSPSSLCVEKKAVAPLHEHGRRAGAARRAPHDRTWRMHPQTAEKIAALRLASLRSIHHFIYMDHAME